MEIRDRIVGAINDGDLPQYLYKYRTINSNLDKILINSELKFSKPTEFNDPFDYKISPEKTAELDDVIAFLKQNNPKLSDTTVKLKAHELLITPGKLDEIIQNSLEYIVDPVGICCFSKISDSILMWSHYSDWHKGICFKFDILKDFDFFSIPLIVNYSSKYPIINLWKNMEEFIDILIKTKSNDWEYEEEIRVHKTPYGFYKFNKESLVGISFGCKAESKEINRVIALAKTNGYAHLQFYKAKLKDFNYGFDFEFIN